MKTITEKKIAYGFDGGTDCDIGVLFLEECAKTITNGTCPGHHNHVLVVERTNTYHLYQDTIGALCATDYKWVQQEQVMQGKLIVCVLE